MSWEFAGVVVGSGEGVDAVVVVSVRDGGEFVEEVVGLPGADEAEQVVFGGGGDGLGAEVFGAGDAGGADVVAAEDVVGVAVGECFAGAAGVLFDPDRDVVPVAVGCFFDDAFDGAGGFADPDDVGDVVDAGLGFEFELESDGPVGVGVRQI